MYLSKYEIYDLACYTHLFQVYSYIFDHVVQVSAFKVHWSFTKLDEHVGGHNTKFGITHIKTHIPRQLRIMALEISMYLLLTTVVSK